eukprot:gene13330-9163_t
MSRTIILSNIPVGSCEDHTIRRALLQYGTAVEIQVLPHQSQAVVSMRTPQEAQAACRGTIMILGSVIRVTPGGPPAQPQQPPHHSAHAHHPNPHPHQVHHQPSAMGMPPPGPSYQSSHGYGGKLYRVNLLVEDCRYPITQQVLTEMFSQKCSPPVDVYCASTGGGSEPQTTAGYADFADLESANKAVQEFHNKPIYSNCCFVRLHLDASVYSPQPPSPDAQGALPTPDPYGGYHPPPPSQQPYQHQPYAPAPYPPMHGGVQPMPWGGRGRGRGRGAMGVPPPGPGGYPPYQDPYKQAYGSTDPSRPAVDTTVIVSNVAESVPLYDLWVLLEVYGNVTSLKRQYKDKTNVVAQFQNSLDAKSAVTYLQGCPFREGRTLSLKLFSGYVERGGRVEWNAGPATDPSTQAVLFTIGFHHRTKPSATFNRLGRIRPDKNIFVSNLIESITDEEVKTLFEAANTWIVDFYRKNASVAIVSFREVAEAVDALIAVHAKKVQDRYLRITFSRWPPGPPPDGAVEEPDAEQDTGTVAIIRSNKKRAVSTTPLTPPPPCLTPNALPTPSFAFHILFVERPYPNPALFQLQQSMSLATPGTGARHATAATQLYFRLCHYRPLTILVADALCIVFGAGGATALQLVDYLGVAETKIVAALEAIPSDMRCTAADLDELAAESRPSEKPAEHRIYYLNYKGLLPAAYAHVQRLLLALCATPAPWDDLTALFSASLQHRRGAPLEAVRCRSCQMFHDPSEMGGAGLEKPLAACPACGADVVRGTLEEIKAFYSAECAAGRPLLAPPPSRAGPGSPTTGGAPPQYPSRLPPSLNCPLARDPLLVQQALLFLHQYRTPFACVNDDPFVVDVAEMLTQEEFERRRSGAAVGAAEQFRALHRSAKAVHVRLESAAEVRRRKALENQEKISKRAMLPPWLRPPGGGLADAIPPAPSDAARRPPLTPYDGRKVAQHVLDVYVDDEFERVEFPSRRTPHPPPQPTTTNTTSFPLLNAVCMRSTETELHLRGTSVSLLYYWSHWNPVPPTDDF